ncbi:MAG: YfhO family protein [Bacteroidales bacterium]|nr:YfhO family protein [Bacteroidales bacterium]
MNLKKIFSVSWPHAAVIIGFVLLSVLYFLPILEGRSLPQMDNTHAIGAANELVQYEKTTGEKAQWTDSMFGGMPAYQIKGDSSSNIFHGLSKWLRLGLPYTTMAILFMYMLGFYVLMVSLKMNRWVAIAGSVAFAFGSYNLIIIAAGHITKAYAIALMPSVIAGVMLVFSGHRIIGGIMTAITLGLELAYNHIQITYYLALCLMVMLIAKFIYAIKDKTIADFGKNVGILCAAALLAILPSVTNLWTTYEYGKYSIRGASELTSTKSDDTPKETGLDREYAFSWSYGIHETPTLIIPNVVGGASEAIGYENKTVQELDTQLRDVVAQQVQKYWGGRAFTSGPVYVGAVICFLFFIGLFYYEGREKWWLVAATIFSIMLAWGKNFAFFNDFMFYHFPLYNKFRTVEMALVIATVTIPMLGMLGLKEIWENPERIKYELGKFFAAIGLTGGVCLLIAAVPTLFYDFMSEDELAQFADMGKQNPIYLALQQGIIDARIELTRSDALRSAVFIILASSALWFFSTRTLSDKIAMSTIIVLVLIDLWQIDRRYLGDKNFSAKANVKQSEFVLSEADKAIMADKQPHRVMSLYVNPFNEVRTSYFHQSVGGYHGAKLRRYQDVIDRYLVTEYQMLVGALQNQDYEGIDRVLGSSAALNMLNTKYFIYNPQQKPLVNPYTLGAAWFVDAVAKAETPDEAIKMIGAEDLATTAIIEGAEMHSQADSTSTIVRTRYAPDALEYQTKSATERVAVFSEIFYDKGWKAYIDGNEAEIVRANYILRALQVPAGEHTIRFEFRPQSYAIGNVISIVASIIIALLVIAAAVYGFKTKKS